MWKIALTKNRGAHGNIRNQRRDNRPLTSSLYRLSSRLLLQILYLAICYDGSVMSWNFWRQDSSCSAGSAWSSTCKTRSECDRNSVALFKSFPSFIATRSFLLKQFHPNGSRSVHGVFQLWDVPAAKINEEWNSLKCSARSAYMISHGLDMA